MKKTFYKMLLAIAVIATAQFSHAQSPNVLKQVVVLNQGPYGGPVTVGSYDPLAKSYKNFDSLPQLRFANDVIIDSNEIYVAADSLLIKYDLATKTKLATQVVHGIREITIWNNQVLVTRGDVSALTSYFQAYDKNNLNLLYELTSVSAATEGIKVLNDTAYVAVNAFGDGVGKLAVIDLNKEVENREISLGVTGINPYDVEVEKSNNTVYTINDLTNYDSTSITKYSPATGTFVTTIVNDVSSCNGSTYYLDNIYFQSGSNNIQVFRTSASKVWDSLQINKSIAGLAPDTVHGYMYVGNTDYATYGKVFIYDLYGNPIDSFNSNIDPGFFAFDVESNTGINKVSSVANLQLYPNPVTNQLHLFLTDSKGAQATVTLTNILGQQVYKQQIATNASQIVPMNLLTQGIYFLNVETTSGQLTRKIVKE